MRVVVGEDQVLFRAGLVQLLRQGGFEVVAEAGDAEELVRRVNGHKPDVVVSDVRMPPTNTDDGLRAAIAIRKLMPGMPVVLLSQYVAAEPAIALIADGAEGVGYLLKDSVRNVADFLQAVRRVAGGGSALDPQVISSLVGNRLRGPLADLTPREMEVLALMAEGHSNQGIAERIVVTEHAVEKHVGGIMRKLDLSGVAGHRRVLAVLMFLRDQHGA